eukprot:superscaffoldBa00000025_g488
MRQKDSQSGAVHQDVRNWWRKDSGRVPCFSLHMAISHTLAFCPRRVAHLCPLGAQGAEAHGTKRDSDEVLRKCRLPATEPLMQALLLLSTASVMSYYMDPVSSYPALHPCDRLGAMRQSGGVAVGPQTQLPGVVHPQQQYYPSQPLYPQDIPLQEVPNGHDMCPTVHLPVFDSGLFSSSKVIDAGELGRMPRE